MGMHVPPIGQPRGGFDPPSLEWYKKIKKLFLIEGFAYPPKEKRKNKKAKPSRLGMTRLWSN